MQREVDREGLGQDHDEQQPAIVRQCVFRVFLVVQVEALGRESPIQRDFLKPLGMPKRPTGTEDAAPQPVVVGYAQRIRRQRLPGLGRSAEAGCSSAISPIQATVPDLRPRRMSRLSPVKWSCWRSWGLSPASPKDDGDAGAQGCAA